MNWNELIDEVENWHGKQYDLVTAQEAGLIRENLFNARTALLSAILEVEKERDDYKNRLERAIGDKDTYCAYCGQAYSLDDPESPRKVGEHIAICSKHPMRKVEQERDALKEAMRWIPVEERLPEDNSTVWVSNTEWKHTRMGFYERDHVVGNRWLDMEYDPILYATHWMPLPAVPERDVK